MTKKILIVIGVLIVFIALCYGAAYWFSDKPLPQSTTTPTTTPIASSTTPAIKSGDVTLGVGKSGTIAGLTVTFNSVVQDNRCPVDVVCIEAGAVTANVTFTSNGATKTFNMPSDEVPQQFDGYSISITKIAPDRMSKVEVTPQDYRLTFHIASLEMIKS